MSIEQPVIAGAMKARAARANEDFIGYEYKNITASRRLASLYVDCYPYFGWEVENSATDPVTSRVSLTLKRNRKMRNKVELNKLQHQFEQGVESITHLEKSKTTRASVIAYTVGLLGTAFMAGATFAFLSGIIALCIVLAVPGFIAWGLAYVLYRRVYAKRSAEVVFEVEKEFDGIYSTCEKASLLLA